MDNRIQNPMLLELAAKWLAQKAKEYKIPLCSALAAGILAHMFAFTNKLVNHDEVYSLFEKGATVISGRWGLGALDAVFPNYSMPWIYGILTIVLMAVSCCIIVRIFSVRSKLLQSLLAGLIVVFPSLTGTFGYMFTSSSYAVSFFLAVLSVWLIRQDKLWYGIPALICMILSLSIYQSYISIAASMLVLVLIQQLLHGEDFLPVLRRGISYIAFLVLSLGAYYIATQVVFVITGTEFGSYAASSITLSASTIFSGISLAYSNFLRFFTESYHGLIPTVFSRLMHQVLLAAICILLLIRLVCKKDRKLPNLLLLLVLIGILPLAINCMYLITAADSIHTLVLYSFIAVYILAVIILEECLVLPTPAKASALLKQLSTDVATIAVVGILISNIYIANEAYLNLYLRYENAYAFYTSLLADIKMMPEFSENTKLAVIGDYTDSEYFFEKFEDTDRITGVHGFIPDSYSADRFVEFYLGLSIPFASSEEIQQIQNSAAFEEMAIYPYYGSMQMFGDILVVKLS